ncbi:MAG: molybdopterin-dependent oxidoreductase [Pseudomonadota bacterium]
MSDPTRPRLPPNQGLIQNPARWPVVGEAAPRAGDDRPWTIRIDGLAARPATIALDDLRAGSIERRTLDFHCVTRWSKFDMTFVGAPLSPLLDAAGPAAEARWIRFIARSDRDHDTSLSLDDARALDPLIAFAVDLGDGAGERPLPSEHGGPVRVITPGKYGYKSLKWLERIEIRAEPKRGYWESGPGYHDNADPWAEERYVSGNVPPDLRDRMIAARRIGPRELVSVDFRGADLDDLAAPDSRLRNCRFDRARLRRADFRSANLSNASLREADLRDADLTRADLEGADFSGADLTGARLGGASLFGATFHDPAAGLSASLSPGALEPAQIGALVDDQAAYVRSVMD